MDLRIELLVCRDTLARLLRTTSENALQTALEMPSFILGAILFCFRLCAAIRTIASGADVPNTRRAPAARRGAAHPERVPERRPRADARVDERDHLGGRRPRGHDLPGRRRRRGRAVGDRAAGAAVSCLCKNFVSY